MFTLNKISKTLFIISILILLNGCSSNPPKKTHDNICHIYNYDSAWEKAARHSANRWGTPDYILMAFIHQESRFKSDAQPSRPYALGFIPLFRSSSAYGYSQAQNPAWYDYQKATGNRGAKRTSVQDSLDFIGWYNYQSHKRNHINRTDAYHLYLAYHEGNGGYARKTYNKKPWLLKVAKKVQKRAYRYKQQLKNCSKYQKIEHRKEHPSKETRQKVSQSKSNHSCNAPWPYC